MDKPELLQLLLLLLFNNNNCKNNNRLALVYGQAS